VTDSRDRLPGSPLESETGLRYLRRRVRRHVFWARTQGVGRLIEEDQLNPLERIPVAAGKWAWRLRHGQSPGSAVPLYLVGLQRSGTNMLVRGLERSPQFEVHNENDSKAFTRFRLRPDADIAGIIARSPFRFVLFKPLCDSHRIDHLLDKVPVGRPGRAIWAFRDVDGRVRSALAKFGDANLQVLREIAEGRANGRWQAERVSPGNLALIRRFDYDTMTPASAAALFWYVRNSLFFEMALHLRPDVMLSSYDAMVADPQTTMRALCGFLDFPWRPELVAHIAPRPPATRSPLEIDPLIREHCDGLRSRLDATAAGHARRWSEPTPRGPVGSRAPSAPSGA